MRIGREETGGESLLVVHCVSKCVQTFQLCYFSQFSQSYSRFVLHKALIAYFSDRMIPLSYRLFEIAALVTI